MCIYQSILLIWLDTPSVMCVDISRQVDRICKVCLYIWYGCTVAMAVQLLWLYTSCAEIYGSFAETYEEKELLGCMEHSPIALLRRCKALLRRYRALLRKYQNKRRYRALLKMHGALLWRFRALLKIYRALLRICLIGVGCVEISD